MKNRIKRLGNAAMFAEIISAIAVVITVVYLTIQIKDNTRALKSQGHYNALSIAQSPIVMTVVDQDLATIVLKGYIKPDSLSSVEQMRFYDYLFLSFNGWEYLYYANESESIPSSLWVGADAYYGDLIKTNPGIKVFWQEYKHAFAEPFLSYVEQHIEKNIKVKDPIDK
jgi:hypothetical protein